MKRSNIIKMLSLLLSAVLFLASCGEEVVVTPTPDTPPQQVAPEFKSYFDINFESKVESLKEAIRFDGEVIDALERDDVTLLLIKDSCIDELNRVCETFRVYNVEKGDIIAPVTNVYDRVGAIPENSYSSNDDKQISTVNIDFIELSALPLVEVKTTVLEKIEEDIKQEDETIVGDYVTVSETYVYYDVYGNEITECYSKIEAGSPTVESYNNDIRLNIGRTVAVFDGTSYKLLSTFDSEGEIVYSSYDYANDNYYYYGSNAGIIKVYDKANKLVYSKQINDNFTYFVMNNGNIFLQVISPVLGENKNGDFEINDRYYNMNTYIIDVASGKETAVETNLVVVDLYTAADLLRYDYPVTENTKNLVIAYDIEREQISAEELKLYVCDNEFNILFRTEKAYPIQTNPISFESLSGGYFALGLQGVADRVIISPEGKTVSFLREGLDIREGFIVSDEAIYDYSLNTLYDFDENGVEIVTAVGNSVIVVNKPAEAKPGEPLPEYVRAYKRLNLAEDGTVTVTDVFSKELEFSGTFGNVIVMMNENSGKYSVFNYKCEHLLTTDGYMTVIENNGEHAVVARNGGIVRVYVLD